MHERYKSYKLKVTDNEVEKKRHKPFILHIKILMLEDVQKGRKRNADMTSRLMSDYTFQLHLVENLSCRRLASFTSQ